MSEKNRFYLALSMMAGIIVTAIGSDYLSKAFNINDKLIFPVLYFLLLPFLVDFFDTRRSLWEIFSNSRKDRFLFLFWLSTLTFVAGYLSSTIQNSKLMYKLFSVGTIFIGGPYILIAISSFEIRKQLKEKIKFKKQEEL